MSDTVDPFANDTSTAASRDEFMMGSGLPVQLGYLRDMHNILFDVDSIVQFCVEEFNARACIDRRVEIVTLEKIGAPAGRIENVIDGWHELRERGCLAVMGPHISDSCIELKPVADKYKMPTIATGGTAEFAGPWSFGVQWADLPYEGHLIANYCAQKGYKRIAVTWDSAYHSSEYLHHLRAGARRYGIRICAEERISQLATHQGRAQALDAAEAMKRSEPDAIVHMGTGTSGESIARAVQDIGWDIPRIMNDAFFIGELPHAVGFFEGWVGLALYDEENITYTRNLERFEKWSGTTVPHGDLFAAIYTLTTTLLEGLRMAPILSRAGMRRGLEGINLLPSAIGGPRMVVGYSQYSRRGVRGPDVLVLRRIEHGKSVFEGRFDPSVG